MRSNTTPAVQITEVSGLFARKKPIPQQPVREVLKRDFSNVSQSHIAHNHSLSLNSDGETFLTADELRVYLWNVGADEVC